MLCQAQLKLTPETLRLMKRSGCLNLHVGFESGNDEIPLYRQRHHRCASLEFGQMVRESGLKLCGEFTFGHVGETREMMEEVLN